MGVSQSDLSLTIFMFVTIFMFEYRVTKYNPEKRNEMGHYTDDEEWTDFSEVGTKVSLEEYLNIESAYINLAIDFMKYSGVSFLKVVGLEDYKNKNKLKENESISVDTLESILRSILRNEFWCRLESKNGFIHFGWDYYMYIGVSKVNELAISHTKERGLFVEEFISPYHPHDSTK